MGLPESSVHQVARTASRKALMGPCLKRPVWEGESWRRHHHRGNKGLTRPWKPAKTLIFIE